MCSSNPNAGQSGHNFQAFYSEITASVTHELNNILGTIEQVAGLLEDLAMMPGDSESATVERLGPLSGKIIHQTDRGMNLVKRLNRFAHLGDEVFGECDVRELTETLAALSERFARMRSVTLTTDLPEQSVLLFTNPVQLSEILFRCVKRVLHQATPDSELMLRLSPSAGSAMIKIEAPSSEDAADSPQLPASQDQPEIKVVETRRDNHICIEIVVTDGGHR
jgi:C4-dicarboxylate-specific signal transduction histidine kinase